MFCNWFRYWEKILTFDDIMYGICPYRQQYSISLKILKWKMNRLILLFVKNKQYNSNYYCSSYYWSLLGLKFECFPHIPGWHLQTSVKHEKHDDSDYHSEIRVIYVWEDVLYHSYNPSSRCQYTREMNKLIILNKIVSNFKFV